MREVQNSSSYLQADETRLQVLKEDGKTALSDKWMWVIRGGPPEKQSVLFESLIKFLRNILIVKDKPLAFFVYGQVT